MEIFITNIEDISLDYDKEISPHRRETVQRLKMVNDKKRCIASGLFEKKFLGDANIFYNEYKKPYTDNGKFFNISHSGDFVLFAIGETELGCDIERLCLKEDYVKLGKIVFCENEIKFLKSSENMQKAFFYLWTRKESILKCLGGGFYISSKSIDVSGETAFYNGTEYYFKMWYLDDYTVAVCSANNNFPEHIKRCAL
jgi:4'-phosphopantetheinyl transferase